MSRQESPPGVTVAMLGARMHYAVPRLLHEAGLLERFYTDSYAGNKPLLRAGLRALPAGLSSAEVRRWLGREDRRLAPDKVISFEWLGLRYAFARRRSRNVMYQEALSVDTARRFNTAILQSLEQLHGVIWGFNSAALELFEAAKAAGATCVLEQTILPRRLESSLLAVEADKWPGWQPGFSVPANGGLLAEREEREWQLADWIVAGSDFVRDGLIACGVAPGKIRTIPYGVDVSRFPPPDVREHRRGPLQVLFVGEVGLRKGGPGLLEALRRLGPDKVQARFAGLVALDPEKLAPYRDVATFLGPVPRSDMAHAYRRADVYALPSIVEGSATSTYEALLSGLPLVVTPNTGAIICGGDAGQLVPAGDVDAIAEALERYCEDRALWARHREGAIVMREEASAERYGRDLTQFIRDIQATVT